MNNYIMPMLAERCFPRLASLENPATLPRRQAKVTGIKRVVPKVTLV